MIGCYVTGILPRPKELVDATRAYERRTISKEKLEEAFDEATLKVINAQLSAGLSYITDGMLKWQDLLRPFAENLSGVKVGSLARWFNNNTFYRKPVVVNELKRKSSIIKKMVYTSFMPKNIPWKIILPAPYTFVQLAENHFYKEKMELMFVFARILREEIRDLTDSGFKYIQLSDPALVYKPTATKMANEELALISEALKIAVKGVMAKTCLQTFFGDFTQILPKALEFPVDHFGIDLYETDIDKIKEYGLGKGIALGLLDSRSSLIENQDELTTIAKELIKSLRSSDIVDIFICPNCDLEFLPWERAEEKLRVLGLVANRLRGELYG
ncbi:MAG: hypothetical protein QXH37_08520 [Candidatus Bathyarchaeia archaeon]